MSKPKAKIKVRKPLSHQVQVRSTLDDRVEPRALRGRHFAECRQNLAADSHAFRTRCTLPQVDPNYAAKTWKLLRTSIEHIHRKNASGLSFEELYRCGSHTVIVALFVSLGALRVAAALRC
jgi:hypothetical protein